MYHKFNEHQLDVQVIFLPTLRFRDSNIYTITRGVCLKMYKVSENRMIHNTENNLKIERVKIHRDKYIQLLEYHQQVKLVNVH